MQFSRSHGQPLQKLREVQEMLKITVCQPSLVSSVHNASCLSVHVWAHKRGKEVKRCTMLVPCCIIMDFETENNSWVWHLATHSHFETRSTTAKFDTGHGHDCRRDLQTEQWSSLWTYQFPHNAPNEPSSTRPSTDALASIFTLNLWQFHVVR